MTLPATATARWPTSCAMSAASTSHYDRSYSYIGSPRFLLRPGDYNTRSAAAHQLDTAPQRQRLRTGAARHGVANRRAAAIDRVEVVRGTELVALRHQRVLRRRQHRHEERPPRSTAARSIWTPARWALAARPRSVRQAARQRTRFRPLRLRSSAAAAQHQLYFPAFDSARDQLRRRRGSRRRASKAASTDESRFKHLTVTGAYGRRRKDVPTASFGTALQRTRSRPSAPTGHALLRRRRRTSGWSARPAS